MKTIDLVHAAGLNEHVLRILELDEAYNKLRNHRTMAKRPWEGLTDDQHQAAMDALRAERAHRVFMVQSITNTIDLELRRPPAVARARI